MMLSEVKRIKIKSNEIERQLEKFFSSLLVCGAEAGWRNALLSWESWILEGRRVHAGCTCCFNYSLTWWFRTLRWTCSLRLASASLSLSLSLSARFSFVFKLKRNVGPFFVGQLVDLSVKREKREKMDSPVGHRPCWYTDTGEERERARPLRTDDGGAQRGRATPDHPFYTLKVSLDPSFSRLSSPPFSFLFCVTCACMNHRSSRGIYSAPRLDQSFRPRGSLQESLLHSPLFILFFSSSFHILFYFLPGA